MNIFDLFHQVSKNTRKNLVTTQSSLSVQDWPDAWKTSQIKIYPRFHKIILPRPRESDISLFESLNTRKSSRKFKNDLDVETFSSILFYSLSARSIAADGIQIETRRYPSAGALYPVEFYVFVFKSIRNIPTGIYHYGVEDNSITQIKNKSFSKETMDSLVILDFAKDASFAVVMTAVFERSSVKYGERAYRFIMLEAGGVAQNLSLCASVLNVGSVQMGGLVDEVAEELLDINGTNEVTVHSVFFG